MVRCYILLKNHYYFDEIQIELINNIYFTLLLQHYLIYYIFTQNTTSIDLNHPLLVPSPPYHLALNFLTLFALCCFYFTASNNERISLANVQTTNAANDKR